MNRILKTLIFSFISGATVLQSGCSKFPGNLETVTPIDPVYTMNVIYRRSNDNGNNELWKVQSDGSNKQKLNIVLPSGWVLDDEDMAEVSSDSKSIVFLAYNPITSVRAIYKCDTDGKSVTKLSADINLSIALQAVVSSTAVLYWKAVSETSSDLELWRINLNGTNNRKINIVLPTGIKFGDEELAKVTEDGKTIIFLTRNTSTGQEAIYKSNLDGTSPIRITNETLGYNIALQSILGEKSVLYRKTKDGSANELWSVNIDGTTRHKIDIKIPSGQELQNEEMAKGTDNGNRILFTTKSTTTGQQAFYFYNAEDGAVKLLMQETLNYSIALQTTYY